MEPVMQVELVDRDGRVLARGTADAAAFPLTVRLAGAVSAAAPTVAEAAWEPTSGPAPRPAASARTLLARLSTTRGATLTSVCTIGIITLIYAAHAFSKANPAARLGAGLAAFVPILLWAGLWALGGRVAHRRAYFARQLTWSCLAALTATAVGYAISWAQFLFPAPHWLAVAYVVAAMLVAVLVLNGHLAIASHMTPRRRWRVATGVVAAFVALVTLTNYADDDFDTNTEYAASLQPLDARFVPATSVGDFGRDLASLQHEVDEQVKP